jgi:tetratricopeptide (TPR) repeat protein
LTGLIVLTLGCSAWAQPGSKWLEVQTEHFTVLSNSTEKDARHVAAQFERMRAVFHVLMPTASDDPGSPIVVLALKDRKAFRTLEPADYLAKNQLELAGFFQRAQDKNYVLVRMDAEGEHPFSTVYHEYTHYMFRRADDWMPLWLGEGLAEFYQNTEIADKDVRLGQPSVDDILYLRQNKLLPVTTLLAVDHNSPYYHDEQKGSVFYAESWALTHYIEITDKTNGTHRLQDYAKNVQQHQDPVTAAQNAFGDLKKLDQALESYVRQSQFKEFHMVSPVDFPETSFAVRPVPSAEADSVRAGVLLSVRRTKDAETLLEEVLKEDPNSALAHETMGELKFREHDIAGARKWYAEAVQLDSKSYLSHYYFAAMSLQAGDRGHDDAIEQSLRESIKLNPRFAPAYDALAEFYATRHERLDEAHMLTLTAVQLEPETLGYRLNAAQVLMENQKLEDASRVLKAAQAVAKTPEEKAMLHQRIADLDGYLASVGTAANRERGQPPDESRTMIMVDANSTDVAADTDTPATPSVAAPAGPRRTVSGVLKGVKCGARNGLTLTVDRSGTPVALWSSNYFHIQFTTANYNPTEDILPCTGIEGMKAKVVYADAPDKQVAGEIVSIELSK